MERKEFMSLVGISVGAVILQNCLSGCSSKSDPTPSGVLLEELPPIRQVLDLQAMRLVRKERLILPLIFQLLIMRL
jgi:hypothetical protein